MTTRAISPAATRTFAFDWSQAYPGNSISSVTVTAPDGGLTVNSNSATGLLVTYSLTPLAGVVSGDYRIRCTPTFADGQIDSADDTFNITY